ncbi:MAG: hypothetical protein INR70_08670 [Parafilimonas terrae]|nr:hypothetical protein [Parafilimonas terrae]
MLKRVNIGTLRFNDAIKVIEGRISQGKNPFKDYAAPNGATLRILNPDIRKEANRRANEAIRKLRSPR